MPDILDPLTRMQADALRALAGVLYPLLGILAIYRFGPAIVERLRSSAQAIGARDAERAQSAIEKLNGKFLAALAESDGFQRIVDERASNKVAAVVVRLEGLDTWRSRHEIEDRQVHDRVKELEVNVLDIRSDVSEIKEGQRDLAEKVENSTHEMKDLLHEVQLTIVKEIRDVERRMERK